MSERERVDEGLSELRRSRAGAVLVPADDGYDATRLEFRLHPIDRFVGGRLTYGGKGVREALRRFRDVAAGSPRDSFERLRALKRRYDPSNVLRRNQNIPPQDGPHAEERRAR